MPPERGANQESIATGQSEPTITDKSNPRSLQP